MRERNGDFSNDSNWRVFAACRGQGDLFFSPAAFTKNDIESESEKAKREKRAKEICKRCPVVYECLAFAFDNEEPFGIWGGLTRRQRGNRSMRAKVEKQLKRYREIT